MSGRVDESERQAYYGAGRQPWDEIAESGFGPAFAASSVLKYMRRTKGEREQDVAKAAWYWARLIEMSEDRISEGGARHALQWLTTRLKASELALIQAHHG